MKFKNIGEENINQVIDKASILLEALPYIQHFNRKIIIIKYGGSCMVDEELKDSVIKDVVLLKLVGFKPIIVHGGGKDISAWIEKFGAETKFINGLRYTDSFTMEIVEMVLNKINKSLVQKVEKLGSKAIGISGKDGGFLKVKKKKIENTDLGFVGEITEVNNKIIYDLLEKDFLPIVCPIGYDDNFDTYNVNADDVALSIAKSLKVNNLTFLTDVGGLAKDINDKNSIISELTITEAKELIKDNVVGGGMLPKLNNCIDAVENGVESVRILDGRLKHSLLLEIFTDQGIGTVLKTS